MKRAGVFLVLLLAAAGCSVTRLYDGPARSRDEVAVVSAPYARPARMSIGTVRYQTRIVRFDGTPLDEPRTEVEVLPGEHTVAILWRRYHPHTWYHDRLGQTEVPAVQVAEGVNSVKLSAKAGRKYRLIIPEDWTKQSMYFREVE